MKPLDISKEIYTSEVKINCKQESNVLWLWINQQYALLVINEGDIYAYVCYKTKDSTTKFSLQLSRKDRNVLQQLADWWSQMETHKTIAYIIIYALYSHKQEHIFHQT